MSAILFMLPWIKRCDQAVWLLLRTGTINMINQIKVEKKLKFK